MTNQTEPTRHRGGARWVLLLCAALGAMATLAIAACERRGPASASAQPRYVVLSPALAVMLRDLGQEDRIVARHAYDMVLDESLPVAGELGRIDYEVLLAAQPTHVLIEWGAESQALPERLVALSRERGFEIQRFSMLTLDDIRKAVDRLEADLPPANAGPEAGYWQERMQRAWNDGGEDENGTPRFAGAGRVLLVAATEPTIGVTGPGSWHHQILEAIGGVPAITTGAAWMELSAEDVLSLAPDGIILIQPRGRDEPARGLAGGAGVQDAIGRLGAIGRLNISAIRSGHVALIDDPLAHTPSTAMVGLTEQMARILAAWCSERAPGSE